MTDSEIDFPESVESGAPYSRCVLVVEDDAGLNALAQKTLRRAGFETQGVFTGADAIGRVTADTNVVLLLDQRLPDMTGTELISTLIEQGCRPPFIAMTGHGDEKTAVEMMKLGAKDYLIKDIELITSLPKAFSQLFREMETERRLAVAERALRESELKYRRFVETANEGVWAMDGDRRTTFVNRRMTEMLGYSREEMLGKTVEWFMFAEDLVDHQVKMVQRREGHGATYERRFRHKDGGEIWTQVAATPIVDENGRFSGSHALFSDITDRKRSEKALQETNETLHALINCSPLAVITLDRDGNVTLWNPAAEQIFGWRESEVLGRFLPLVPDDKRSENQALRERVLRGEGFTNVEVRRRKKDGSPIDISISTAPLRDAKGHVVGMLSVSTDITERKRAEEERRKLEERLQQAQKLESIGTLAGGIAHDFNNILHPLLGFAELLKEDLPADSPLQEHIDQILQSALRSKDLVKQILAFSRKGNRDAKPIRLAPVVKEALKLLRSSIPTTIDIQQELDSDCGVVMADPTQIHQIIMNLATNAYHAMENTGGRLTVSLTEIDLQSAESESLVLHPLAMGKYALLSVSDTGTGIQKEILDKIFDPYFTTKGVGKGTGLGLSVVHGIATVHKGDIRISSVPGKGTKVYVYLPIMERVAGNNIHEDNGPILGGTEKILLVDDEEAVARLEKQVLARLGYRVEEHTSSIDALRAFREKPEAFDLVITDMTMPKMTGVQLAEELISIRPDIPVILCTGFNPKIDAEKATFEGIKGFLMKPVDKSNMAKMVRKVLSEASGRNARS